ncbi:hypothetical protein ACFWY5_12215 [Nonomuraea sp. NPDC059007]|uniref:hypothetical protein n=1 Tax=Nonomuraea sp. NPDC059007 TaxID=3346692 RepID=UPI0036CBF0F5
MVAIEANGDVRVCWRGIGPGGPRLHTATVKAKFIAGGGLSYGTVMTVAAAQGITADHALIYGLGLDPHTLYSAMTHYRQTARLYLPRQLLESDADRARHGPARSAADELQRALAAYAATLQGDRADRLLTPEPAPIAGQQRPTGTAAQRAQTDQEAQAAQHRSAVLVALSQSDYRVGLLTDDQLAARMTALALQAQTAAADLAAAEQDMRHYARHGGGPAERDLQARRERLAEQVTRIGAAEADGQRLARAREALTEDRRQAAQLRRSAATIEAELAALRGWRPSDRARRRVLAQELPRIRERLAHLQTRMEPLRRGGPELEHRARRSAAQAPPATDWPQIRREHQELTRAGEAAGR